MAEVKADVDAMRRCAANLKTESTVLADLAGKTVPTRLTARSCGEDYHRQGVRVHAALVRLYGSVSGMGGRLGRISSNVTSAAEAYASGDETAKARVESAGGGRR